MTAIRKSGPCVAYTWSGALPAPDLGVFLERIAAHRFRTIENAASEETSFGWVTPEDPSGDSFSLEDMDAGSATWLRLRFDVKKLPAEQLRMHLAAAKRAKGKSLTSRERRELKDDLIEKLLPRVLPSTRNVDALLFADKRLLLVFATGKSQLDAFTSTFTASFGDLGLVRLTAGTRAIAKHSLATVNKLAPTRFPGGGMRQLVIESNADFLGQEFLTWLWWRCAHGAGEFTLRGEMTVGVAFDAMLQFAAPDDEVETTLRHGTPAESDEAAAALRQGRLLAKAQVLVAEGARQWVVAINGASMALSVRLDGSLSDEAETDLDRTSDRAASWLAIHEIVQGLFEQFLAVRVGAGWAEEAKGMAAWMQGGAS